MAYLVSFALLVALGAWIVGVYHNLEHLRGVVCSCWGPWRRATHRRNECLNDYVAAFAVFMPVNSTLPHDLRRMVEASESSLALALEPMPHMLILDEPLSGVDVEGMDLLMQMLDEIRRTYDLSILITTHDFSMLERYCDRVVLISHRILKKGTPLEVLSSEEFLDAFHMGGGRV